MKVRINYKREHVLQVPQLLEKAFTELKDVQTVGSDYTDEPDLVVNSMPWNGNQRGKHTVYWELDIAETAHYQEYQSFQTVYFPSMMNQALTCPNGKFLPMANDFDYYHPFDVEKDLDVIFMGRMDRSLRAEYIERLEKSGLKILNITAERGLPTAQMLSRAKCSFQISEFKNLEQRNFEYSGVLPMVLERVEDIDKVFTEDEHYKGYDRENYEEFESQIRWCVDNYEDAIKMRDRMIKHLKKNHTYKNRALEILKDANLQT